MPKRMSAGRVRRAYQFIEAHRHLYPVQVMCTVLEVAPSGYYEWLQNPISNRAKEDARLLRLIRASFIASHGIYGAPRVFLDLREAGETCSKHRVERLMRQNGLRALHGYRTRRVSVGKPSVLIPNVLKRQFTVTRPNRGLGHRYNLHSHVARLAVPGRCHGSLLASDRGLGDAPNDSSRARARCSSDGRASKAPAPCVDSLGSGYAIWQRCLAALLQNQSPGTQHEPPGQLLGQRGGGVVLQQSQERTNQEAHLQRPR